MVGAPEGSTDLDRLVEVEARMEVYRSRRKGVLLRMFFLFLPVSVLAFLAMEPRFSVPIIAMSVLISLSDHLVHYNRFRAAERERALILAERDG
jgi:hypothetical protein